MRNGTMFSRAERVSIERRRVEVEHLVLGLFVCELDRPWTDTPFPLQGLLLRRETDILTLRSHCRYVHIDLNRCTAEARAAYRKATRARGIRALEKEQARGVFPALMARLRAAFGRKADAADEEEQAVLATLAARIALPPNVRLQRHPTPIPLEQALPRAREAVQSSADALDRLISDLRNNVAPDLHEIDDGAVALVESALENPDAVVLVSRMRSEHRRAYEHGLKTALHLLALGRHLGFPKDELLHLAMIGMLADVGKTLLPRVILEKPDTLTPDEYATVKGHVTLGMESLRRSGIELHPKVVLGILEHHERMDGSGYPRGMTGERISIYGRMAAIADCFSALITERPHARALAPQEALLRLYEWSGSLLHEPLLEQLVQAIGVFPVGSLVELSSGEVAIVTQQNRIRRLEPRVLIVAGPDKQALEVPVERDLMIRHEDGLAAVRITKGLAAGAHGLELHAFYADSC